MQTDLSLCCTHMPTYCTLSPVVVFFFTFFQRRKLRKAYMREYYRNESIYDDKNDADDIFGWYDS